MSPQQNFGLGWHRGQLIQHIFLDFRGVALISCSLKKTWFNYLHKSKRYWKLTAARPTGGLTTRGAVWFCIQVVPVSTGRKDSRYQEVVLAFHIISFEFLLRGERRLKLVLRISPFVLFVRSSPPFFCFFRRCWPRYFRTTMARYEFETIDSKKIYLVRRKSICVPLCFLVVWLLVIFNLWPSTQMYQNMVGTTRHVSNESVSYGTTITPTSAMFSNNTHVKKIDSVQFLPWLQKYTRLHTSIMVPNLELWYLLIWTLRKVM